MSFIMLIAKDISVSGDGDLPLMPFTGSDVVVVVVVVDDDVVDNEDEDDEDEHLAAIAAICSLSPAGASLLPTLSNLIFFIFD